MLDELLLNKILGYDMTLSNVFMRSCKRIYRQIHQNQVLMKKLAEHYQSKIVEEVQGNFVNLFLKSKEKIAKEIHELNQQCLDEIGYATGHQIENFTLPRFTQVDNILVQNFDPEQDVKKNIKRMKISLVKTNKRIPLPLSLSVSEIRSFRYREISYLLSAPENAHIIEELKNNHRQYEKIVEITNSPRIDALDNFMIVLEILDFIESQKKMIPPLDPEEMKVNMRNFVLLLVLLYVCYTFLR